MFHNMGSLDRKELQDISASAEYWARDESDPTWKRAYEDLAYAADRLDAMIAREDQEQEG